MVSILINNWKMKGDNVLLAFFVALFLFSIIMIVSESKITGYASSGTAISNVSVSKSFSITLSGNLTEGITFGNLTTINYANATGNNNWVGSTNQTTYNVNVSSDSTVNVDFCIKANAALTDSVSGDIIAIGNETYGNATTNTQTSPGVALKVALTTSNVKSGQGVTPGISNNYRFWLDVPSTTPSGTYNNTLTFTGVEQADACP
ncbi:hypothetical protein J4462_02600 [Candidatus Pacearchaeota archaeon]|nr:hypothetical protein [Candidatus Pacearchaeota archaeon]